MGRADGRWQSWWATGETQDHSGHPTPPATLRWPFLAILEDPLLNESFTALWDSTCRKVAVPAAGLPRIPQGHLPASAFTHGTAQSWRQRQSPISFWSVGAAPGGKADRREDTRGTGGSTWGSPRNEKSLVLPSPTRSFHHLGLYYFLGKHRRILGLGNNN